MSLEYLIGLQYTKYTKVVAVQLIDTL